MDVAAVGTTMFIGQLVLGGAVTYTFRRAWQKALLVSAEIPMSAEAIPVPGDDVAVGAYLPNRQLALIAPALAGQSNLAALAVHLHEIGHREQHLSQPLAVWLQWPLRATAVLAGGLGMSLLGLGLLLANSGFRDLGMILSGANTIAAMGVVILEWDASRRGIAVVSSGEGRIPSGVIPLLFLAGLTYVILAFTMLLPILRPEAASSLPSSNQLTWREHHGETGAGDSANQRGSAQGAPGRRTRGHDRGRAGSG